METGRTVILLNVDELYESLYDAQNQYYSELGGDRFVDLGLGIYIFKVCCRISIGAYTYLRLYCTIPIGANTYLRLSCTIPIGAYTYLRISCRIL